jgi:3-hydroxybutyryl-CoA dehydratase
MHDAPSYYLEDLTLDQSLTRNFRVGDADIIDFAKVSQDHNPVHTDEDYAQSTVFKGRIAHGMLLGAFISATIAGGLPGRGSIYVSQTLNFKRAVRPGDEVSITLTITAIDLKSGNVTLLTVAKVRNKVMLDGVAVVTALRKALV